MTVRQLIMELCGFDIDSKVTIYDLKDDTVSEIVDITAYGNGNLSLDINKALSKLKGEVK